MPTVTFYNELNDNKIGYPSYVPRATHRFTFDLLLGAGFPIRQQVFVAQWCNPLILKPEQSGRVQLQYLVGPHLLSIITRVVDAIKVHDQKLCRVKTFFDAISALFA